MSPEVLIFSQLILNLKQVDLEPGFIDRNQSETDSSPVFLSFQTWKKPILIDLFGDNRVKVKTFQENGNTREDRFSISN